MRDHIAKDVDNGLRTVDVIKWISHAALELVGQGTLGYSLDPLDTSRSNMLGESLKGFGWVVPLAANVDGLYTNKTQNRALFFASTKFQFYATYVKHIGTASFRGTVVDWSPFPQMRRLKEIVTTIDSEARRVYYEKKRSLQVGEILDSKHVGNGNDILSSLRESRIHLMVSCTSLLV